MRSALPALLLGLAACSDPAPTPAGYASRGPGPAYACLAPRLATPLLRTRTEPTPEGWRIRIDALAGPPSGWYNKGRIEYTGGAVVFVPDTATAGIAEEQVARTIRPALRACSGVGGHGKRL